MKVEMRISTIIDGLKTLLKAALPILLFEIIYKSVVLIIFKPILNITFSNFIKLGGYQVLLNDDIASFITSIFGILTILIFSFVAVLIVYYEFAVILIMLNKSYKGKEIKIRASMEEGIIKLSRIIKSNIIGLALYILILIPFINIGVQSSFLPELNIPKFISGEILKYTGGEFVIILFILICTGLYAKSFLVLPTMVLEEVSFKEARKKSFYHMKGRALKIGITAIALVMVWFGIAFLPTILLEGRIGRVSDLLKVLSELSLIIFSVLVSPMILSLMLVLFKPFEEGMETEKALINREITLVTVEMQVNKIKEKIKIKFKKFVKKIKKSPLRLVVLLILIGLIVYANVPMNIIYEAKDPMIIGHRGSLEGVENTTEAILNAGKMGAEYAEIDILLSKDGVPMVIHDENLLRLSGKTKHISRLTADEIEKIKIRDRGYSGNISRLEDLYLDTKDDIKLLIELKSHGKEKKSIVDETMRVLEKNNFNRDTIFQTTEMKLLKEFNEKYPDEKMGYIIIGSLGKLNKKALLSLEADFLVFEESIVTQTLVNTSHILNMPIFAWTVNDESKAEELLKMKIDGIITDHPDLMIKKKDEIIENSFINKIKNDD